ncbi:restriction endonuclease subunit S, partial [Schinkia azotoformans]
MRLGDVVREYKETCKGSKDGFPIVGLEHLIPEEINLKMWDEEKENTFTKMFRKGQVLFGRRRAYLKKAAVAPFDGICSGDITVIEAIHDKILPELLPFIIQNDSLFNFAVGNSAGSLSPRVKWENLKNYEFNLPDLAEQKRLAELLWAANDAKEAYKRLLTLTDDLVKSQFIEMFGCPVTNPLGWETSTMMRVAPETQYKGDFNSDVWLLNLDMIEQNTGIVIDKVMVSIDTVKGSVFTFDKDYVLYSKLRPYLNKVVLPDDRGFATSELIPLKPDINLLNRVFLACLLRSDQFVEYATKLSGGSRMPRVPMKEFRNFPCILPPINLQNQFAAFVQQVDKSKF